MTTPTYTTPPAAPSRTSPSTFSSRTDAFLSWMVTLEGELTTGTSWMALTAGTVATDAGAASTAASTASAAAAAAISASGVALYVPSASYTAGDTVISNTDYQTYRAIVTHTGVATDPSADGTNWTLISYNGNADVKVGEFMSTAADLTGLGFLPTDGAVYSQSAYPTLAALISPGVIDGTTYDPYNLPSFPPGRCFCGLFSETGGYFAGSTANASERVYFAKTTGDVWARLTPPVTSAPAEVNFLSASSDMSYIAAVHATSPYITVYSRSGDTFTKMSDPATLPTTTGVHCSISDDGLWMAAVSSAEIRLYKRVGATWTLIADPPTLAATVGSASWSPDGSYLAVGYLASPFIDVYKRTGDTLALLARPSPTSGTLVRDVTWSHDGNEFAAVGNLCWTYTRSGDTFTYSQSLGTNALYAAEYSWSGKYLTMGGTTATTGYIYEKLKGRWVEITAPAVTAPRGGMPMSPDHKYVFITNATTSPSTKTTYDHNPETEFATPVYTTGSVDIPTYIKAETV